MIKRGRIIPLRDEMAHNYCTSLLRLRIDWPTEWLAAKSRNICCFGDLIIELIT